MALSAELLRALGQLEAADGAAVHRAMAMLLLVLVARSVIALDLPLPVRYPVWPATPPDLPGVASFLTTGPGQLYPQQR